MDTLKENVPHFKPYCDVITGHYDLDSVSFIQHAWYRQVAALAIDKPYYNKIELIEDLLASPSHRVTLFLYKTAFIMDDDIALSTMQVGNFVGFGRDGPYFLLAPTIDGRHAWPTQDPARHDDRRQCDVLQTDKVEHEAVLLNISRLDDFIDWVPEENRDNNRRIPCDWGFPRFVCRGLDQNTGTGCAIAGKFGAVVHKDLKSQKDVDFRRPKRESPCDARGALLIQQNHFRYGRLYESETTFKCFSVSVGKKRINEKRQFLLEVDTSWKAWFKLDGRGPNVNPVVDLQEFCKERFNRKAYLSNLTKPKKYLRKDGIYHVHIPKVAGTSFKVDAADISKADVFSEEACLSDYPTSGKHLVLLREPRAHVLSQYYFCRDSDDPGPLRAHFLMPREISDWINFWTRFVSTGKWRQDFQWGPKTKFNTPWCSSRLPFGCYSPFNLQSQRLTCKDAYDYSSHVSRNAAIEKMEKLYFVGIQEAYQESLCLLHGMIHDHLPKWCDCTKQEAWSEATVTKRTHGSVPHAFSDLSQETQEEVDSLTAGDAALYKAGVKRFVHDVRKLEKRLNVQILCKKKLKELHAL
eukprot:TRINITY_DN12915_c0_g2_i2.p1 TRINITY_DN12915_c0_g2~~TRINITY_DN12915_c0_g2_i2.p1  ORF type:complete len:580 (-),score=82.23 TRINITY_DN12915_c0_g2_i2:111-1850(-)